MPEDYFDFYNKNRGTTTNQYSAFGASGSTTPAASPSYTSPSYTPPSAGTQQAQNETSNMGASDWFDAARFAYGVYRDRNPPKPEFENVPLSPEQQQMYQIYMASLLNPATANNASALNQMAQQMLGGMSNMSWQSPQTFSGQQGYGGSSMAYTPPQVQPGSSTWPGSGSPIGPPSTNGTPSPGGMGRQPDFTGPRPNIDPMGPPKTAQGTPLDFFEKYAGKWNGNEETWEKYIARAAALVAGAFGLPIPPALIDKGIDAAQWVYRNVTNRTPTQPLPPYSGSFADVARDAPGTEYVAPLPNPTQSFADVARRAPGTRDQYGNPPAQPLPPPQRPTPWTGNSTPYWTAPTGSYNPSDPNNPYAEVPWNAFGS